MIDWDKQPEREIIPGFHGRFAHSERMTFAFWRLDAGAVLPPHEHPHEQVVNVFSGELEMTMNGRAERMTAGTMLVIPSGVRHEGRVISDARVLDVFAPVREDYRDGVASVLSAAMGAIR